MASGGAFGKSMKSRGPRSKVVMKNIKEPKEDAPSPFFSFPSKKLDGTDVTCLGDLVDGKKAILVVNVASE